MSLFDAPEVEKEIAKLEEEISKPDFWNDNINSSKILKKTRIRRRNG